MIPKTIVRGAHIRCSFGDIEQRINLPVSHGSYILGAPVLIMTDSKVGDNIPCFGTCRKGQPKPCSPVINTPWYDEKEDYTLDGTPTITTESFLVCAAEGGLIEFLDSGQETAASEAAAMGGLAAVSKNYLPLFALSIAALAEKQPIIPTGEDFAVRDFNVKMGKVVDWDEEAKKGEGVIRIYKREDKSDEPVELHEGVDFYIKDGKSYYYNNVRTILEAQDYGVEFDPSNGAIAITSLLGVTVKTLNKDTNYTIGYDGKAHFKDGGTLPPGAEKPAPAPQQQTSSGQTGAGTASSTQISNEYGFIWPIENLNSSLVSSKFDINDSAHTKHRHRGIDINVPKGTPVLAIADGRVFETAEIDDDGRGYYVYIDHGNGVRAVYQHHSKNLVAKGDYVSQGDIIALVGRTGAATGYHLHLELMLGVTDTYDYPHIPYDKTGPAKEHKNPLLYLPQL